MFSTYVIDQMSDHSGVDDLEESTLIDEVRGLRNFTVILRDAMDSDYYAHTITYDDTCVELGVETKDGSEIVATFPLSRVISVVDNTLRLETERVGQRMTQMAGEILAIQNQPPPYDPADSRIDTYSSILPPKSEPQL